jgi:AraC family transcriptional regulator
MNFRIEEHEAIHLTGLTLCVSTDHGRKTLDISAFWDRIRADGTLVTLLRAVPPGSRFGCLGVYLDDYDVITHEFTYLAAIETPAHYQGLPRDYVDITAPAGTWAVFESRGALPTAIQNVWNHVFREWFPAHGYEHRPGPELEVYPEGDIRSSDYYCEVWIPVKKAAGK